MMHLLDELLVTDICVLLHRPDINITCLTKIKESLAMSTSVLEGLPGKLQINRHSPSILYLLKLN